MKIETYIDSLVSYAMNCGLAEPEDHQVLGRNWKPAGQSRDWTGIG